MAKVKFSLNANPTFKAKVEIPVPGDKSATVEFLFKGRSRDAFKAFIDSLKDREDVDVLMDIASGWDLEDAFDKENVELLTQNYLGAARAIIEKYLAELTAARLGN
jgi:hypothetical protein